MEQNFNFDLIKDQLIFPEISDIKTPDVICNSLNTYYKKTKPVKNSRPKKSMKKQGNDNIDEQFDAKGLSREELKISRQIFLIENKEMPKMNKKIKKTKIDIKIHPSLDQKEENIDLINLINTASKISTSNDEYKRINLNQNDDSLKNLILSDALSKYELAIINDSSKHNN